MYVLWQGMTLHVRTINQIEERKKALTILCYKLADFIDGFRFNFFFFGEKSQTFTRDKILFREFYVKNHSVEHKT